MIKKCVFYLVFLAALVKNISFRLIDKALIKLINTQLLKMTKRIKSKHKVDRRLKVNLWGRPKSPFNTRAYPPGQHGQNKKGKPTDYGVQLNAKQ